MRGSEDVPVRIAYLILAHRYPEQLARLVAALPEDSPVFIHIDLRAGAQVYDSSVELLGRRGNVKFVRRHACRWGSFGIVQATITLIDALHASKERYDYASLLSGADYPIKSNREIAAFLSRNRGREFIESFLQTKLNRWSAQGGLYKSPDRVLRRHLRFRSHVFRLPGRRKMPAGLLPYGGSQWWTLTAEAITYIAEFVANNPRFVAFSKLTFIPDESFIQIIISSSHLASRVTGDNLRLIVWGRPHPPPYPIVFTSADLGRLLASDKFFARKFDPGVDSNILQALDERIGAQRCTASTGSGVSAAVG